MIHPLSGELKDLSDQELEKKLTELNKKYYQAARFGNPELLTQVETFVTIYKDEMSRRYQQKQQQNNQSFDNLINVD